MLVYIQPGKNTNRTQTTHNAHNTQHMTHNTQHTCSLKLAISSGSSRCGTYNTQHYTTQHTTHNTQHNTTQHNTTQHNTTQHNTTQHDTTQHNTEHNITQQHRTREHTFTKPRGGVTLLGPLGVVLRPLRGALEASWRGLVSPYHLCRPWNNSPPFPSTPLFHTLT